MNRCQSLSFFVSVSAFALADCSSSTGSNVSAASGSGNSDEGTQTPPTSSETEIDAWLGKGYYKTWHCEMTSTAGSGISPHGAHRICSNDALSGFSGTGEYPVGSANVKELFDSVGGSVTGYAIELHQAAGTNGRDWFWYEKMGGSAVANAAGASLCVGCHMAAGSDAMHPGHDFVFSQVK